MGFKLGNILRPAIHIGAAIATGGATIPVSLAIEKQRAEQQAAEQAQRAAEEQARQAAAVAQAQAEAARARAQAEIESARARTGPVAGLIAPAAERIRGAVFPGPGGVSADGGAGPNVGLVGAVAAGAALLILLSNTRR